MATEKIQIIATAQDRASGQLKKLRGNVQALGSRVGGPLGGAIGGLSGLGGGLVTAGIVGGLATEAIGRLNQMLWQGIGSALAEEQSLKRLDTALEANIEGWNGNRDAIDKVIDSRMDLGFQDDELRDSMIKLVTSTKDVEEAQRLQSLAMDVARGRNIDLAAATDIVNKANMGNIGALRRLGINIDKTATKTEALALLQERYAGQAEAFTETTVGKLTVANTKVSELQESMGNMLLPIIANTATAASNAADQIERMFAVVGGADFASLGGEKELHWAEDVGKDITTQIVTGFQNSNLADKVTAEGQQELDRASALMSRTTAQFKHQGVDIMENLADGIRGNKDVVKNAMDDVKWALAHPLKGAKALARIEGALASDELAAGLASKEWWVRETARQSRDALIAQWEGLTGRAYGVGEDTADSLTDGITDNYTPPKLKGPYIGPAYGPGTNPKTYFKQKRQHFDVEYGGARAAGGRVNAGQTYLVGERGPEMVTFGSRGTVSPNGGGNGDVYLDGERVGRVIYKHIDRQMGKNLALSGGGNYTRG